MLTPGYCHEPNNFRAPPRGCFWIFGDPLLPGTSPLAIDKPPSGLGRCFSLQPGSHRARRVERNSPESQTPDVVRTRVPLSPGGATVNSLGCQSQAIVTNTTISERPFGAVHAFLTIRSFQGLRPWLLTNAPSGLRKGCFSSQPGRQNREGASEFHQGAKHRMLSETPCH